MTPWRLTCSQVWYEADGKPSEEVTALRRVVFSPRERAFSARRPGLASWAGRLAAKRAVADVLGLDSADPQVLALIEILPRTRRVCDDPRRCADGHPPAAVLGEALGRDDHVEVSIAHDAGLAFAGALMELPDHRATEGSSDVQ